MIQRIQSLFLLAATVLTGLIFATSLLTINAPQGLFTLTSVALKDATGQVILSVFPLTILVGLMFAGSVITIFLFKNRMLQIRIIVFTMVLNAGFYALFFFYLSAVKKQISGEISYEVSTIMPIINLILLFLAMRAIGKDEALVRSLERIR